MSKSDNFFKLYETAQYISELKDTPEISLREDFLKKIEGVKTAEDNFANAKQLPEPNKKMLELLKSDMPNEIAKKIYDQINNLIQISKNSYMRQTKKYNEYIKSKDYARYIFIFGHIRHEGNYWLPLSDLALNYNKSLGGFRKEMFSKTKEEVILKNMAERATDLDKYNRDVEKFISGLKKNFAPIINRMDKTGKKANKCISKIDDALKEYKKALEKIDTVKIKKEEKAKAKAEMIKAKEEVIKLKEELAKAKAEEKAKAKVGLGAAGETKKVNLSWKFKGLAKGNQQNRQGNIKEEETEKIIIDYCEFVRYFTEFLQDYEEKFKGANNSNHRTSKLNSQNAYISNLYYGINEEKLTEALRDYSKTDSRIDLGIELNKLELYKKLKIKMDKIRNNNELFQGYLVQLNEIRLANNSKGRIEANYIEDFPTILEFSKHLQDFKKQFR